MTSREPLQPWQREAAAAALSGNRQVVRAPRRRLTTGLPAVNRMTAAEMRASDIGDHDEIVKQVMRALAEHGYLAHAEPKALAVDRKGRQGWRTPTKGPKGWPDIVAVREHDGAVVVAEVKTGTGRLTPEQRRWLESWRAVARWNPRVRVFELRPSDLQDFYDTVLPPWEG
jgi:hypothetical protein